MMSKEAAHDATATESSTGSQSRLPRTPIHAADGAIAKAQPSSKLAVQVNLLEKGYKARYTAATDEEALSAYQLVTKYENLNPSLEPSHAFAEAIKIAPKLSKDTIVCVCSCGDAYKDKDILKQRLGI